MSKFTFKVGQNVRVKGMDGKYHSATIVEYLEKTWYNAPRYGVIVDNFAGLKVTYVEESRLLPASPLAGALFE